MKIVGRTHELDQIMACLEAGRNILLEGPVGVGKTRLAIDAAEKLKRDVYRIDGDGRYSEQKISGWFDPPTVIKVGYSEKSFVPGPLVSAMREGGILFINEMNRLPEGVQNVLLPAIDEKKIQLPKLGEISAKKGFSVIATQNPKEFVATSHLSEAILDRFELIALDYQSAEEESEIVKQTVKSDEIVTAAVWIARLTRNHEKIRRGASIRAAQSIGEIAEALMKRKQDFSQAILAAALLALPTRIELEQSGDSGTERDAESKSIIEQITARVMESIRTNRIDDLKKKT
ncbi:MAG: MoxR family ATPase [Xanthomonadaceae bacterium]|nr:MoxR family ATPase [Xanthomonadaceae bacterium]